MSEPSNRQVLVVGGAGYLGNVVVRRLLAKGYRVRVLDDLLFGHGSAIANLFDDPAFSFVRGDLCEGDVLARSLDGATDVVLLAAMVGDPICSAYPELANRINGAGAQAVFDEASKSGHIDRFVFTSTCSNYGLRDSDDLATEESALSPVSLYAETKVSFEQHVLAASESWGCSPTLLRIATAYGLSPRMRFDLSISEFTRTLAIGDELLVYDADTWRPYCHVADISLAIETVLAAPSDDVRGEIFNVGHSDENYTKRMLVEAITEHLGGQAKINIREGGTDPRNYRVSFEKIRERLGFEPVNRVPETVGRLIEAIGSGAYDDYEQRRSFYANNQGLSAAYEAHAEAN